MVCESRISGISCSVVSFFGLCDVLVAVSDIDFFFVAGSL